jgi:MIP family channel proteins
MKSLISEFTGTFFLILMGCGAIVVNDQYGVLGHIGVAICFGLVVMIMIYSVGNISGAHLNPAVTFGFFLAGRIKIVQVLQYFLVQFLGAAIASFLLKLAFPGKVSYGSTHPAVGLGTAFFIEMVVTALLIFVILNVSTGHREKGIMAGVAVGGTVALCALTAGPLTGASMNPARSLGPALAEGNLSYIWIYLTAPFIGAALVARSCRLIQGDLCCSSSEELE